VREQPTPDCPRLRSAFGPRTGRAAPSSSAASRASGRSASIPSVDHADALGHESPGQQACAEFGLPPRSVTSGRSWRVSSTIAPGRHDLVRGAPEAGVGESSGVPVLVGRGRRLGIDQARSTCGACFSGVAPFANAVEHVGVTDRYCYLDLAARIDFG